MKSKILGLLAAVLLAAVHVPALAAEDSKGTDFWLMFDANLSPPEMSLFITGDTNTSGVVSVPGLAFSAPFTVTPGTVTTVVVPAGAHVTALDSVTNQGVRVVANDEVTVYGLNRVPATTDAYLGLPTDILGTSTSTWAIQEQRCERNPVRHRGHTSGHNGDHHTQRPPPVPAQPGAVRHRSGRRTNLPAAQHREFPGRPVGHLD